jgi:hypothetical protein
MLLGQIPACLWKPEAYLEKLPATPRATLDSIRKRLRERIGKLPSATLIEKDGDIAAALPEHVASFLKPLPMTPVVTTNCEDFFQSALPAGENILLPLNPPYGLRLAQEGKSRPMEFYRELAGRLQKWPKKGQDLRGFVLIPDDESLQVVRQKLGAEAVRGVQSFSQGGQHIRCLAFQLNGI